MELLTRPSFCGKSRIVESDYRHLPNHSHPVRCTTTTAIMAHRRRERHDPRRKPLARRCSAASVILPDSLRPDWRCGVDEIVLRLRRRIRGVSLCGASPGCFLFGPTISRSENPNRNSSMFVVKARPIGAGRTNEKAASSLFRTGATSAANLFARRDERGGGSHAPAALSSNALATGLSFEAFTRAGRARSDCSAIVELDFRGGVGIK
jgi:hypothetical protein